MREGLCVYGKPHKNHLPRSRKDPAMAAMRTLGLLFVALLARKLIRNLSNLDKNSEFGTIN